MCIVIVAPMLTQSLVVPIEKCWGPYRPEAGVLFVFKQCRGGYHREENSLCVCATSRQEAHTDHQHPDVEVFLCRCGHAVLRKSDCHT